MRKILIHLKRTIILTRIKIKIKRRWGRTTLPYPNGLNGSTAANTRYTATVTLTSNTGFTFNGLATSTINGNTAAVTNNTGNQVTLSYQFPATLEIPTTPPDDIELIVNISWYENINDGDFISIMPHDWGHWEVLPNSDIITGEITIISEDPDMLYVEHDGYDFWFIAQFGDAPHTRITVSVPTTAGVLTRYFYLEVMSIVMRSGFDMMTNGVTTIYTYDVFNRLIGVNGVGVSGNAVDAQYTYRPDGLRIAKVVNGNRTTHLWDGANIVAELDNDNNIKDVYIRGIGLIKNGQNQWFLFNARGDVVALTDEVGNVVREYRYDAFGNELNPNPDDTNPWRFTGEYFDRETGTIYLRMRHYNPRIGRFTQSDPFWNIHNMQSSIPAIMQASNLYAYVMNNPIMWRDPLGLFAWNERDDQWITVSPSAARNAGGRLTQFWCASMERAYAASLSIWGVDVTFNINSGLNRVRTSSQGHIQVRADFFYSTIVGAAGGEMSFLGGHGAFGGRFEAYHMFVAMFAAPGSDAYSILQGAGGNTRWGLRYGFISGGMGGFFNTIGEVNRADYLVRENRQFFHHLSSSVGTTATLFAGYRYFMANHSRTFAYSGRWTNSTSFTIGLVNSSGLYHGLSQAQRDRAWGFNNAFRFRYFGM